MATAYSAVTAREAGLPLLEATRPRSATTWSVVPEIWRRSDRGQRQLGPGQQRQELCAWQTINSGGRCAASPDPDSQLGTTGYSQWRRSAS